MRCLIMRDIVVGDLISKLSGSLIFLQRFGSFCMLSFVYKFEHLYTGDSLVTYLYEIWKKKPLNSWFFLSQKIVIHITYNSATS